MVIKGLFKMNTLFYTLVMAVVLLGSKCEKPGIRNLRKSLILGSAAKPPETKYPVHYPSLKNIESNKVALINGFNLGTSMMALATVGARTRPKYPTNDLLSGQFYTDIYRWALRAISLIPDWLATDSPYPDSQKLWRKRFYYMESEVPQWLRSLLFFVKDWELEEDLKKRYILYTKPSFDKHLRYPSKVLSEDFESFKQTRETVENLDDSEVETVPPRNLSWGPDVDNPYDDPSRNFLQRWRDAIANTVANLFTSWW